MTYSDQLLVIEITIRQGDGDEKKRSLLAEINRNLVAAGVVGADDAFVLITEIGDADVSFGRGLAQRTPARTRRAEPESTSRPTQEGNTPCRSSR